MTKSKPSLIERIKRKAIQDQKRRQDPRYKKVMGFLVAKGFLRTNEPIHPTPRARLGIEEALWVGEKVEPRVLEVLPAAVVRLPQHFLGNINSHPELECVVRALRERRLEGPNFLGNPYQRLLPWLSLPLLDKRIKTFDDKRILKTFRLQPEVLKILRARAKATKSTETDVIENLILKLRS